MFSRPGKSSTSKFRILLEKDVILKKQFRLKYPEKRSFITNKLAVEEINQIAEEERKKLEMQKKEEKVKFRQLQRSHSGNFIFKVQSRNDFQESNQIKICAPPPGTYNLNSTKSSHIPGPSFSSSSKHLENFQSESHFHPRTPRKPLIGCKSIVPLNKQLKRRPNRNFNMSLDVSYNPDYSMIDKKVRKVDMNKTLSRQGLLFASGDYSGDYDPNKEFVMVDLGKVPNFGLMSKRKELFRVQESPGPYDVNFSATFNRSPSVEFSKMLNPEVNIKSPLPSFMQTIHNRTSIGFASMKTLSF
jgi:hypothetical protein